MTRNSNALMRDGSVMADSDLVDFLSGSTDSAINFSGSADLHTPIHPLLLFYLPFQNNLIINISCQPQSNSVPLFTLLLTLLIPLFFLLFVERF